MCGCPDPGCASLGPLYGFLPSCLCMIGTRLADERERRNEGPTEAGSGDNFPGNVDSEAKFEHVALVWSCYRSGGLSPPGRPHDNPQTKSKEVGANRAFPRKESSNERMLALLVPRLGSNLVRSRLNFYMKNTKKNGLQSSTPQTWRKSLAKTNTTNY
jgi:hypothetical protein